MSRPLAMIVALALANAVCVALMYPPVSAWPLAWVAVIPLALAAVCATRTWSIVLVVGVVQVLLWLWMQRWTAGITQAGYVPLAVYCAIWPTLFVVVLSRWLRHPVAVRVPTVVVVPLLWTGIEFFRGALLFHGYPWFLLAHPLVEWPVQAQSADLLGTYFLGSLAALPAGLAVDVVRLSRGTLRRRAVVISSVVVVLMLCVNVVYGMWRVRQTDALRRGPTIMAVQTNLPQDNRNAWTFEMQQRDLPSFFALTQEGLAEASREIDLVVWPETMVPGVGFEQETIDVVAGFGEQSVWMYRWPMEVDRFARRIDIPMLVGAAAWVGPQVERRDGMIELKRPEHRYNSAYLITGDPPYQRYDKFFLTPFGETMPYISAWPWLEQQMLAVGAKGMKFDLSAAESIETLELSVDGERIGLGTPICFEDCVSHVIRRMVYADGDKRADVLVNISNDGWFTWDDGTRAQRAQISRLRCIENRVPLVRAVNTGLSVHIDSMGNVATVIGDGRYGTGRSPGTLVAQTFLDERRTIYGRIGDAWGWLAVIATTGITIVALRRRNVR